MTENLPLTEEEALLVQTEFPADEFPEEDQSPWDLGEEDDEESEEDFEAEDGEFS